MEQHSRDRGDQTSPKNPAAATRKNPGKDPLEAWWMEPNHGGDGTTCLRSDTTKRGCCAAMVPRVCPFSVMLCNFDVASQMLKFRLALTDEKQRERTETTWARMASGLHMWSQSPPTPHTCVGWRRGQNRDETS